MMEALLNATAVDAGLIRIGDYKVNRLGYGAMRITGPGVWGEPEDIDNAVSVLKRAIELGVNFIDTADAYGPEVSENLICKALFPYKGIVIATKGGLTRSGPGIWTPDCSPAHLRSALEGSLKRLKIDRIDLYQLHTVDPSIPFEESFQTLIDMQREGKITNIGLSNIEPENFLKAMNMGRFESVQNNYNVFNREHEDVLRLCEKHSVAFIPYFPVGGNTGSIKNKNLEKIALKYDASPHQIALAWLLDHSSVMLPIPGTSSLEHLEENILAADIELDDEDIETLDSLSDNAS